MGLFRWLCRPHVGQTPRTAPPAPNDVHEILVMKFLGMGSVLQATPLFQALRSRYPGARLTLLTFRANRTLADLGIGVDALVTVDTSNSLRFLVSNLAALRLLWRVRFDLVINLEFFAAYGALMTAVLRKRIAMAFGGFANYRNCFFDDFISYDSAQHVQQKFLNFARRLGYDGVSPPLARLHVAQPASVVAEIEGREGFTLRAQDFCVLVNINSGEMAPRRRWPEEHFRTVVEDLLLRPGLRCVLIGGPQDRENVDRFHASLSKPRQVVNLAGRIQLQELTALMELADLYLGNDSGPLHLAACVGLPVLALFGPESPQVYGPPVSPRNTVLYRGELCGPCLSVYSDKHTWCGDNICLKRIRPGQVLQVLEERYLGEKSRHRLGRQSLPLVSGEAALWRNEGCVHS
jgi:ADP-heptose:LPS heptosyltransferase